MAPLLSPKAMFAVAQAIAARLLWMVFIFSDAAPFHQGISKWPLRKRDGAPLRGPPARAGQVFPTTDSRRRCVSFPF